MFSPGIRVVRGPDWNWHNQDGGEGHVGTICEIGRTGSTHSPEKTVVVNWDSGHRTNYRVGYQGQYDLIIVDNAQIGVKHPNIICDGCTKVGIAGIRFRCGQCTNYDLCASCYGKDCHDLDHPFIRYQTANSVGVRVPTRQNSTKFEVKGIFVGAKVIRGPDWEWGLQDGGEGKVGRVMEIRGWDNESCRSVANVLWVTGSTNVYRLGHKGNVDLKYLQAAVGGYYYKNHMPILGQIEEQQPVVPITKPTYIVGDRVKVCLDKEALVTMQQGHGGWNPRMSEYLSKIGMVHRITEKGDIRVQYDGCANRWTFHPAALIKVHTFHVGDLVTIINDAAKVQQLQKGHGEWVDTMRNVLNKTVKVIKVYTDGDLRIQQLDNGIAWTFNPKCVKLEGSTQRATATERSNSMMDLSHHRADHVMMPLSGLSGTSAVDKLVREAAQGRIDYVQAYLNQHPDQVNVLSAGKTCLQVAAHQGHFALVKFLLSIDANVNVVDKEGDSTLHYAAFGNQPEIMRVLLQHGAEINILNSSHCSALHISAHKKPPHCVRILLEFNADVNIQDSYGDTALHDAVGKENSEVIELLCGAPNLDLSVRNNRGFNALHHAALKGNLVATKRILQLARQLVDVKKNDGFAALHLAALNGHAAVVEALVRDGQADVNIRNNRKQTPFLLAVSQGHAATIEKLVELNCFIQAKDEDGDNAMHLCVIKKSNLVQEIPQQEAPQIWEIYQSIQHITENRLMCAILCYLAKNGCSIEANNKGKKILDWVWDKQVQELILSYAKNSKPNTAGSSSAADRVSSTTATDAIDQQFYSNIQMMALNESGIGSANHSSISEADASSISLTNPPTPLRRIHNSSSSNSRETPVTNSFVQHISEDNTMAQLPKTSTDRMQIVSPSSSSSDSGSGGGGNGVGDGAASTSSKPNDINSRENKFGPSNVNISPIKQFPNASNINRKEINSPPISLSNIKIINKPDNVLITDECIVCNDILPLIRFEPCLHQICCEVCAVRMKKCLICGMSIEKRIVAHGRNIINQSLQHHQQHKQQQQQQHQNLGNIQQQFNQLPDQCRQQQSVDRLLYLENKLQEFEETHFCSICMEGQKNVAFLCGHSACSKCAETLKTCHMCRKTIVKKINLY